MGVCATAYLCLITEYIYVINVPSFLHVLKLWKASSSLRDLLRFCHEGIYQWHDVVDIFLRSASTWFSVLVLLLCIWIPKKKRTIHTMLFFIDGPIYSSNWYFKINMLGQWQTNSGMLILYHGNRDRWRELLMGCLCEAKGEEQSCDMTSWFPLPWNSVHQVKVRANRKLWCPGKM